MGILDNLFGNNSSSSENDEHEIGFPVGLMNYGKQKNNGSHDHRYNTDNDRTPAQKEGDKKRTKD